MKEKRKTQKGITLIALIITIIILLILAMVSIRLVIHDGIIGKAKDAVNQYAKAQDEEQSALDTFLNGQTTETYEEEKKVNAPVLKKGMTPVKYEDGQWKETSKEDPEWYNYLDTPVEVDGKTVEAKKWANVKLEDGSMFVWIPRYAYKITKLTESNYTEDKVSGNYIGRVTNDAGSIEVVYLKGNTDDYEGGRAQRGEGKSESTYVVHPSFTADVSKGGWDSEITGYWVAKFEAGYQGEAGNPNSATDSSVTYTETDGWSPNLNEGKGGYGEITTNYYGANQVAKEKAIKYPTFTGNRPSYNYISVGDAYSLCLNLKASDNPYGLDSSSDSHLMKNSEWGGVVYLAHSKYGRAGNEISINSSETNDSSTNGQRTVCGKTGGGDYANNVNQSTTDNIYGIYDLNGGMWEYVASYLNNGNENIDKFGSSMKTESSTKYVTIYEQGKTDGRIANYQAAKKFYGDAVTEISLFDEKQPADTTGDYYNYCTSWFHDLSIFPTEDYAFFGRGGHLWKSSLAGSFAFDIALGNMGDSLGFRAVIV